jgi:hypothetical protein
MEAKVGRYCEYPTLLHEKKQHTGSIRCAVVREARLELA